MLASGWLSSSCLIGLVDGGKLKLLSSRGLSQEKTLLDPSPLDLDPGTFKDRLTCEEVREERLVAPVEARLRQGEETSPSALYSALERVSKVERDLEVLAMASKALTVEDGE